MGPQGEPGIRGEPGVCEVTHELIDRIISDSRFQVILKNYFALKTRFSQVPQMFWLSKQKKYMLGKPSFEVFPRFIVRVSNLRNLLVR